MVDRFDSQMNYYEILKIPKNATAQEIKASYKKLALKWHPDKNKSKEAEQNFKLIVEAYEVLRDPQKKEAYDMYGKDAAKRGVEVVNPFQEFGGFNLGGFMQFADLMSQFQQATPHGMFFGMPNVDEVFVGTGRRCHSGGVSTSIHEKIVNGKKVITTIRIENGVKTTTVEIDGQQVACNTDYV